MLTSHTAIWSTIKGVSGWEELHRDYQYYCEQRAILGLIGACKCVKSMAEAPLIVARIIH